MQGSLAVVWALWLACLQPAVFPRSFTFRSSRARPRPALDASAAQVACFSDYMTLQIPSGHVEGLRRWLGRILHLPGAWGAPARLDSLLAKCGFLLYPAPGGDFVFQARYSACFVQKEKANYRLEIRILQRGVRRLERSGGYVMKCPVVVSRPGRLSVRCGPAVIQVSRPLPLRSNSGQTPWLLSLRGELVASLEDASLMGLYVDINATGITIQSPRQELLQRQEVLNASMELLPLWLVSGYYAYSLEAACPLVLSLPEPEILVHIPKQRLGLVKRGSRIEEPLSLKSLQVHQSDTFTVTENRDFVVVSVPAAVLLQVQPCQEAEGALGTQAFYRVDLSLEFAEMAAPVLWKVENIFPCKGSGTELPASTAVPRTIPPTPPPGPETPPAGTLSAASSWFQDAGPAAREGPPPGLVRWPSDALAERGPGPVLQTARPAGGSRAATASLFPRAMQHQPGSPAPPGAVGSPGPPPTAAMLSSKPVGAVQAVLTPVFPAPTAGIRRLSSGASSPLLPPWRSDPPPVTLGSGSSGTLTEGPGALRPEQDSVQPPGSPLPLGGLSGGEVASTESVPGEPARASEEFQPLTRPLVTTPAEEALVSHHSPRVPQETSSVTEAEEPPRDDRGLPWEGARGHLGLSSPAPSLLGIHGTSTAPRGSQQDTSAHPVASRPEPPERHRVEPTPPLTAPPELTSTSKKPAASSVGGSDRAPDLESPPKWPTGWHEAGAAHMSSLPPLQTLNLWAPAETVSPYLAEPQSPFPAGQGTSPQQESTESTPASSPGCLNSSTSERSSLRGPHAGPL